LENRFVKPIRDDSARPRRAQVIEATVEDHLPGVPGEQAEDEEETYSHELQRGKDTR
jgi:hypothetical protein